jgi:hypothetical protein
MIKSLASQNGMKTLPNTNNQDQEVTKVISVQNQRANKI